MNLKLKFFLLVYALTNTKIVFQKRNALFCMKVDFSLLDLALELQPLLAYVSLLLFILAFFEDSYNSECFVFLSLLWRSMFFIVLCEMQNLFIVFEQLEQCMKFISIKNNSTFLRLFESLKLLISSLSVCAPHVPERKTWHNFLMKLLIEILFVCLIYETILRAVGCWCWWWWQVSKQARIMEVRCIAIQDSLFDFYLSYFSSHSHIWSVWFYEEEWERRKTNVF